MKGGVKTMGEGELLRIKATMYSKSLEKKGHEDQIMQILEVLLVMRRIPFVYKYKL
jgi:hypothetical protein